jgi:hypothetical protein
MEATDSATGVVQQIFQTYLNSTLFASQPASWAGPAQWSYQLTLVISKSFNFVLHSSDSVRHSFNFVFDRIFQSWLVLMTMQRSCQLILVFSDRPVVLSRAGLFAAYLCLEGPGRLVSRDELRNWWSTDGLLIQFTIQRNLADSESLQWMLLVMRSQVNNISSFYW